MMAEIITATAVKALVENIVKEIITPKIKQFCNRLSLEYDKKLVPTAEHFSEYLVRTYDKYSIANTLVLRNHLKSVISKTFLKVAQREENKDLQPYEYKYFSKSDILAYDIENLSPYSKLRTIVDLISGMTDRYAVSMYQKLSGQRLA